MSELDKDSILVDLSETCMKDLMENKDSPLLESLRRLIGDSDTEAVAGFSQGLA